MKIAASVVSTIFKYYCIRTYMDTALKRKQNVPAIRRGLVFFTAFFLPPAFPNLGLLGNFLLLLHGCGSFLVLLPLAGSAVAVLPAGWVSEEGASEYLFISPSGWGAALL